MNQSATATDAVFHMHEITKVYGMRDVEVHALRGVTLDLLPGEFVVMPGPPGSGKSTLLNILGGLDIPASGEVHYRDHNLTEASREELSRFRREHVGFVFQFYNLIPSLTALENTSLVTEISTNPLDAEECLRMVGLGDRLHHFPRAIGRWRATARCHRPRRGQKTRGIALRRTDGRAGLRNRKACTGLTEGEDVILHPSNQLKDGVRVRTQ